MRVRVGADRRLAPRILGAAARLALSAAVLASTLFQGAYTYRRALFEETLKRRISALLFEKTRSEIAIGAIGGSWVSGVALEDVEVSGVGGAPQIRSVKIKAASLSFDPMALALGDPSGIKAVEIEDVEVAIDFDKIGPDAEPGKEAPGPFPDLEGLFLPSVRVRNLMVTAVRGGTRIEIRGICADSAGGPLGSASAGIVWSSIALDSPSGRCGWGPGTADAAFSRGGVDVRASCGGLDVLDCRIGVPAPSGPQKAAVSATVRPFRGCETRISGFLSWPPGSGFEADVEADVRDAGAVPELPGLPLPRMRGAFGVRAHAEGRDWDVFNMSGRLEFSAGEGELAGIRLESIALSGTLDPGLMASASGRAVGPGFDLRISLQAAWDGPVEFSIESEVPDLSKVLEGAPRTGVAGRAGFKGACSGLGESPSLAGRFESSFGNLAGAAGVEVDAGIALRGDGMDFDGAQVRTAGGRMDCSGRLVFAPEFAMSLKAGLRAESLKSLLPPDFVPGLGFDASVAADALISVRDGSFSVRGSVRDGVFRSNGMEFSGIEADAAFEGSAIGIERFRAFTGPFGFSADSAVLDFSKGFLATARGFSVSWDGDSMCATGPVVFGIEGGIVRAGPFSLEGAGTSLSGGFEISGESLSGKVRAGCADLQALGGLLPAGLAGIRGAAEAEAELSGSPGKAGVRLVAGFRGIRAEGTPELKGSVEMSASGGSAALQRAVVETDGGMVEISARVPFDFDLSGPKDVLESVAAILDDPGFEAELRCRIDDARRAAAAFQGVPQAVAGRARLEAAVRGPLRDPACSGVFSWLVPKGSGTPLRKLRFSFRSAPGGLQFERGQAELSFAEIGFSGFVPVRLGPVPGGGAEFDPFGGEGEMNLDFRCEECEIENVAREFGFPGGLSELAGRCRFAVRARGTLKSPEIAAEGVCDGIEIPLSAGRKGDLSFSASYSQGALAVHRCDFSSGAAAARCRGSFPVNLGLGAAESGLIDPEALIWAEAVLTGFDPGMFAIPGGQLRTFSGIVSGETRLGGTYAKPALEADFRLSDGDISFKNPALPRIGAVSGTLEIREGGAVAVIEGDSSGGSIRVESNVAISSGRVTGIHAEIEGKNRPLVLAGPPARVRSDFSLRLHGTPECAVLSGSVKAFATRVEKRIDLDGAQGEGGEIIPGFSLPGIDRVDLDVAVTAPEGVRITSEIFQSGISVADICVDVVGDMRILGPTTSPYLIGRLYSRRGWADLPFYRLTLAAAQAEFTEANPQDPVINVLGRTARGNGTIYVNVNGPLSSAEVSFRSDPPMPEEDIRVFLVTGMRPSDLRGSGSGQAMGAQILALVARQITPRIFGKGVEESILDRVSFQTEKDSITRELRYSAGFRIFDWLYLTGEKDERGYYNGKVTVKLGFKVK